jgi:iron complex transport system substrate-binding protein
LISSGLALAASGFPALGESNTRTVRDVISRFVRIKWPVERVVIATHYNYEDFTAIAGAEGWSKVVGMAREPWEDWRALTYAHYAKAIRELSSIPDVGTLSTEFDADKVIALKPDVVVMNPFEDSLIGNQVRALTAANIPIVYIDFNEVTPIRRALSIMAIGHVMGTQARASQLVELYDALWKDVTNRTTASDAFGTRSCYIELAESSPDIVGFTNANDRLWGSIAAGLGALNIADGKVPDYGGQLPAETLLSANPDIIIFSGSSWPSYRKGVRTGYETDLATTRATLATYTARPGYERLKAVKAGAVHAIEHNLAWSLRDVYAMQYIGKQLYPEQFTDIDPAKGLAEFHDRFLPVPFSGTWFASLR